MPYRQPGKDYVLAPGMVFTIEPMINLGGPDVYQMLTTDGPYIQRMDHHLHSGSIHWL